MCHFSTTEPLLLRTTLQRPNVTLFHAFIGSRYPMLSYASSDEDSSTDTRPFSVAYVLQLNASLRGLIAYLQAQKQRAAEPCAHDGEYVLCATRQCILIKDIGLPIIYRVASGDPSACYRICKSTALHVRSISRLALTCRSRYSFYPFEQDP